MHAILVHGDGQADTATLLEHAMHVYRLDSQGALGVGIVRLEQELAATLSDSMMLSMLSTL